MCIWIDLTIAQSRCRHMYCHHVLPSACTAIMSSVMFHYPFVLIASDSDQLELKTEVITK
jgi:hypothetical protein